MVYVFLANGFEESEAVVPIDCLRRAEINTVIAGVGSISLTSSHGLNIHADILAEDIKLNDELEMIVLPGGMPGTLNLEKSKCVSDAIDFCAKNHKFISAICAAPSILGRKSLLKGRDAVCYSGFESQLIGANILNAPVAVSDNFITARGAGAAFPFGFKLVEVLTSKERADKVAAAILY